MRYFFKISYDGTEFRGFQRQSNTANTIQQTIEESIIKLLPQSSKLVACGRTDKGVHARNFYFHIDHPHPIGNNVKYKLNRMLPPSITVLGVYTVNENCHARYGAVSRTYQYFFHLGKHPFLDAYSCRLEAMPDLMLLREALDICFEFDDFKYFCRTPLKHESTICQWKSRPLLKLLNPERFMIEFTANRFLKSMIRILAFDLLACANADMTLSAFRHLFENGRPENQQVKMMPPQGLYLNRVDYNFDLEALTT